MFLSFRKNNKFEAFLTILKRFLTIVVWNLEKGKK